MNQGIVQIVVAIIGLLAPVVEELVERKNNKQSLDNTAKKPSDINSLQDKDKILRGDKSLRLLNLSIILLYGVFFSAILADSLVVSGRTPQLDFGAITWILFITLFTTFALTLGWYSGKSEFVVGILSITTLVVLFLSPGGVFIAANSKEQTETGLSLMFPVFVLVLLVTSSIVSCFGNPFTKGISPQLRRRVALFLALLFIVSSLTLGKEFVSDVSNDERTPKFESCKELYEKTPKFERCELQKDKAERVLSEVRKRNLAERGLLYELGSEIALAKYYRDSYYQILSSLNLNTNDSSNSKNIDSNQASGNNNTNSKNITNNQASANNSSSDSSNIINNELSVNDTQTRINVLKAYTQYFSNLPSRQRSYLADRLWWVHPTVKNGNNQINLALPGTTPESRFKSIAIKRMFYALSGQQNLLKSKYFKHFTYPPEIIGAFNSLKFNESEKLEIYEPRIQIEEESSSLRKFPQKTLKQLFPEIPNPQYRDFLYQQLALPELDELFITYSIYKDFSPYSLETKYKNEIEMFKKEFDTFKPEMQRAFIEYLIDINDNDDVANYKILSKVADTTGQIPDLGNSISAPVELATYIDNNVNAVSSENIKAVGDVILKVLQNDADSKEKFIQLLQSENPQIPIRYLLNQDILNYLKKIKKTLTNTEREELFNLIKDPVTPTIKTMASTLPQYKDTNDNNDNWLVKELNKFSELTLKNQEAILNHLAIAIYRADGDNSLDPISLLILQAMSLSYLFALICGTILMIPIVLSAILLGAFWGYKIVERNRIEVLTATESSNQKKLASNHKIGIPVELQGRQDLLEKLRKLSGRGWSTIAIVGRRGVGKSRILHELYQPTYSEFQDYGIKVWMSAPSHYQEEDFIESTLEQLALKTEQVIANYLGAESLVVRRLELLLFQSGLIVFLIASSILIVMLWIIYHRLSRHEVMITWFPIFIIFIFSIVCLIIHITRLQPLDLTPWLESDRIHSPHTVFLYRRVQEVFNYISSRKMNVSNSLELIAGQRVIASIVGITIGFILSFTISTILSSMFRSSLSSIIFFILFLFISLLSSINLYNRWNKKVAKHKKSLMSLISEYRDFATTIVSRLHMGALDGRANKVIIYIDELDKIIELDDIRNFLRRMKGIFEIPGIYYYLSISEDALAALYLGSTQGKNEVDSSLDHIVRIPPLSWVESVEVTKVYLQSLQKFEFDKKIIEILVATSFGIPRDILRRCDELLARKDALTITPKQFIYEMRIAQIKIAAEAYGWLDKECDLMTKQTVQSAKYIIQILEKISEENNLKARDWRAFVLIWILCVIEFANDLEDSKRLNVLKPLYTIGYRISFAPPSDLLRELKQLDSTFFP
jgi:hypothetical protein